MPTHSSSAAGVRERSRDAASGRPADSTRAAKPRRTRNPAEHRRQLLDAAQRVFTERGYEAGSVRDIVRCTDLAPGTFYHYFPDKAAVFRALLYEMEQRRRVRAPVYTGPAEDFQAAIERGFRVYFEFVAADIEMFRLLRRNSGVLGGFFEDPELAQGARATQRRIEDAIRLGQLPPVDAEMLAGMIVGISWEIAARLATRDHVDVEAATRLATTFTLGGLSRLARTQVAATSGGTT